MGGELHQCSTVGFQAVRRRHISKRFCALRAGSNAARTCEVCWSGPTSFAKLHRMPVEDLCRRFASPLFVLFVRRRCGDGRAFFLAAHGVGIFVSHASRASLVLMFLLMTKRTHTRRESFLSYVGPHALLEPHQQRGAAEDATQNRAGIPVLASHGPGVRRRAVRPGRFPICCGLLLIRSPAPRRDVVRPLKKLAASSPVYFSFFSGNEATSK